MTKSWIYILECADGSYYTGNSTNLEERLYQHNIGEGGHWKKGRLPVKLVFFQCIPSKEYAYLAEQQIKRWSRANKIALINNDWNLIKYLAKKPEFRK
ncbi:MAG: GIY-YIG nuclease family protein [Anaerolineales bacterium]|nr:GIY-YIG nuclease family protein [Anaerolineales bacterium]